MGKAQKQGGYQGKYDSFIMSSCCMLFIIILHYNNKALLIHPV